MQHPSERGFEIQGDVERQLIIVRLWGQWERELLQEYAAALQRQLPAIDSGTREWSLLLDLSKYPAQSLSVERILRQQSGALRQYPLKKQGTLVNGTPVHVPESLFSWADVPVVSYFQSENEAMSWLLRQER